MTELVTQRQRRDCRDTVRRGLTQRGRRVKAGASPKRSAFDDLADARCHDPFSFLGPHVTHQGVVIRAMLPNAVQATLIRP